MIALAFFAGILLIAVIAILIVRGAKAPARPDAEAPDDDRMRSLSVRTPERDADFWDIANHEPEASRVEYRFLDIPYEDEA